MFLLCWGREGWFCLSKPCGESGWCWQGAWVHSSSSGAVLGCLSPQLARPHRTAILRAMEKVVSSHTGELDKAAARAAVLLASREMTKAKVLGAWAGSAGRGQAPPPGPFCPSVLSMRVCLAELGLASQSCALTTLLGQEAPGARAPLTGLPAEGKCVVFAPWWVSG